LSVEDQKALEDAASVAGLSPEAQERLRRRLAALNELRPEDWKRIEEVKLRALALLKSPEYKKPIETVRGAVGKIGDPEFQKQLDAIAREGAKANTVALRQDLAGKLNSPEFKKQVTDAMVAVEKLNTPEFRQQTQDASGAIQSLVPADLRKRLDQLVAQNAAAGQADGPAPPTGPVRISSGTAVGNLMENPNPVYPPMAKAAHVQGAVVLQAIISKTGTVERLNVVSGPPMLTAAAIDAVKQWKYRPYLLNGEPTEVDTTITVNFTFGGDGPWCCMR
jgi:TonB family protein